MNSYSVYHFLYYIEKKSHSTEELITSSKIRGVICFNEWPLFSVGDTWSDLKCQLCYEIKTTSKTKSLKVV